jgi:capsular polysaccharide biosynthesis protein
MTVIALAAGFGYVSFVKPTYTATEKVAYKAANEFNSTTQNNINAMNAFVGTIVDFCDEGVVIDRANFYYNGYLNEKRNEDESYTVQDYIDGIRAKDTYDGVPISGKFISASNIEVVSEIAEEEAAKFFFFVSYTDDDAAVAIDKVKILVLAFDLETREQIVVDNKVESKYFSGIISEIVDLGTVGGAAASNMSKSRIMILAAIMGVVLGVLLVYIKVATDNSLTEKEVLEEIVGADLLSYLEKQEVK